MGGIEVPRKFRLLSLVLALLCLLTISGCGRNSAEEATQNTQNVQAEEAAAPDAAKESKSSASTAGIIRGKVTDSNSNMLIAGIVVTDEEGNIVRQTTNAYGGYELRLEPGIYTLTFGKGAEYSTEEKTVEVESLKTKYMADVRLTQLYDSYAKGWIAGDCHQHSYYSDGVDSVQSLMISNASVGLYWGFLTDHNNSRGVPEWSSPISVNVGSDEHGNLRPFKGFDGVEVTTEFGHFNSLGSGLTLETYDMNLRESERASAEKLNYIREKMLYILDSIKRVGGIAQMNHPYSSTTMGATNWIDLDDYELLDGFETIEIWNGYFVPPDGIYTDSNPMNQNYQSKMMWYGLLNAMKDGHAFHAATGGTDNHDSGNPVTAENHAYAQAEITDITSYYNYIKYAGKYSGNPTTYVNLDGRELNMENVQQALRAGNSFVSNGPVVICNIDGKSYGQTLIPTGRDLTIQTDIFNRDGISEIRVVVNGETVKTVTPEGNVTTYTDPIPITGTWEPKDWILIEVLGPVTHYAVTNPIIIGS